MTDALVLGPEEVVEYRRIRSLVVTLPITELPALPFTSSLDDLYWCFRQIQAREAWESHGAGFRCATATSARASRSVSASAAPSTRASRMRNRCAARSLRAELMDLLGSDAVLVLPTSRARHR